ncbi:sushi domain-containing protein [Caerostris extrusa]|uniref:Sushi domain-containing protein n=1 Tax=Caerostris extrusa TaxID=172846 RepID=A0AAV4WEL1_CAEEX|nr:sushi domain-containing protein [Caerostris extrusa]
MTQILRGVPCPVPAIPNGVYHHFQRAVVAKEDISHGEVVMLTCLPGFQLMGPDSLRCWYGEWAVDNLPECAPSTKNFVPFRGPSLHAFVNKSVAECALLAELLRTEMLPDAALSCRDPARPLLERLPAGADHLPRLLGGLRLQAGLREGLGRLHSVPGGVPQTLYAFVPAPLT